MGKQKTRLEYTAIKSTTPPMQSPSVAREFHKIHTIVHHTRAVVGREFIFPYTS